MMGVFWDTTTFIGGGGGMLMNVILQLQCIDNDNLFGDKFMVPQLYGITDRSNHYI